MGIGLAREFSFAGSALAVAVVWLCLALRRKNVVLLLSVAAAGLCLGGLRGTSVMADMARYDAVYDQKVVLVGRAVDDAGYGKNSQLSFDLSHARPEGGGAELPGKIGVSGFGANVIFRGDEVRVEGKLRPGTGARQGWMSYAKLSVVAEHSTVVDRLRRRFAAGMQSAVPEPEASFAMGLLIGQRATLPPNVYEDLVMVGLVHIIAVSGYNLTIILRACLKLLGDRSKYQTFAAALALISVFLLLTGASASIVRAAIVSTLSLVAWYYGRTFRPVTLILIAAAITSFASPFYPGGYRLVSVVPGLLRRADCVAAGAPEVPTCPPAGIGLGGHRAGKLMRRDHDIAPDLYIFGQMSAVSLLANVLVAALVPLAMLLSLLAGLAGMLLLPVAGWFAWPATWLLTYMLDAAHLLASIPHVFRENTYISLAGMLLLYGVVLAMNLLVYSRLKPNRAIITALREEHTLLQPGFHSPRSPATIEE